MASVSLTCGLNRMFVLEEEWVEGLNSMCLNSPEQWNWSLGCILCVSSRAKLMYRLRIPCWEFLEANVFPLVDYL